MRTARRVGSAAVSAGPHTRIARTLLHTTIFGAVASLWVWHFGEIASKQPIAQKYGWFSSYMTYDAVTLQFAFFALAMVADFKGNLSARWIRFLDDFACTLFGPVLFVTLSYYVIQFLPLSEPLYGEDYQVMESQGQAQPVCYARGICVPAWVPKGLHIGNSVAVMLDFVLCFQQRTFSRRAEQAQKALALSYVVWLMVRKWQVGTFPYNFMEQLPYPWVGFVLVSIFMVTSCGLLFAFGWTTRFLLARLYYVTVTQDNSHWGQSMPTSVVGSMAAPQAPHRRLPREAGN